MKNKLFGIIAGKHRYSTHLVCFIMLCVILAVHATSLASVTPQIAGGGYYTLALKSDGTVWALGSNFHGQLGDGSDTNRTTPVQVILSCIQRNTNNPVEASYPGDFFL